jgi:hypothetical protein
MRFSTKGDYRTVFDVDSAWEALKPWCTLVVEPAQHDSLQDAMQIYRMHVALLRHQTTKPVIHIA